MTNTFKFLARHAIRLKKRLLSFSKRGTLGYLPIALIIGGIIGIAVASVQLSATHSVIPTKTYESKPQVQAYSLPYSQPTNISIPSVNIQAPIMPVGLTTGDVIQMPPILAWMTGWYKYGPAPGQIGPSIIVGHVDNYENISVFWRLRYVTDGSYIYVTRADGTTATFKVTGLEQVPQNNFPTKQVYGNINYAGLRLITCGGVFSHATESYNENTVVFAQLVKNS